MMTDIKQNSVLEEKNKRAERRYQFVIILLMVIIFLMALYFGIYADLRCI